MAALVQQDDAQVVADSTNVDIIYETVIEDTDSQYNNATGIFTCLRGGIFLVTAALRFEGTATFTCGETVQLRLHRNGGIVLGLDWQEFFSCGATSIQIQVNGTAMIICDAGDTLNIAARQASGGALSTDGNIIYNWASFARIGPASRT
jgi:hypothetical protein